MDQMVTVRDLANTYPWRGRKSRDPLSDSKFEVVNVITSTNKLLFSDAAPCVNLLWTEGEGVRTAGMAKLVLIQTLVSNCLPSTGKKLVLGKFLSNPPPFVSQKMGLTIDEYIDFISEFTNVAEKCDKEITDKEHTDLCTKVAGTFEKLDKGISNIQKNFSVKVKSGGKSSTYKLAITKQLKSFIATLFYCMQNNDAFAEPDPTIDLSKWPDALVPETMEIKEIQQTTEAHAKSIISILENRNLPRDQDRADALRLLTIQLTNLSESEAKTLSADSVKCSKYKDVGAPMAAKFIMDCFLNKLNRGNSSGIATTKILLKSCLDTTDYGEILEYVWRVAEKVPKAIDVSEAIKAKEDIPVKDMAPTYKCQLTEPPPITVKHKFEPPVYHTSGDWLSFVEFKAIPYFMTHSLSYSHRASALWHCLPTANYRNRYLKTFGDCISGVKTLEDFAALYRSVGQSFWPEQILLPHDFEKKLRTPSFIRQFQDENHDDFVYRLQETFESAYPSSYDSDTNKLKLCEIIFSGIREAWLKNILFNEHYDIIFVTGEVNKLLQIMKKEKLKSFKARALAKDGLSLNFISDVQNKPSGSRPRHKPSLWAPKPYRPMQDNNTHRSVKSFQNPIKNISKLETQIRQEHQFLVQNRNVGPDGKLIIPLDRIPHGLKTRPGFDARNYVSKETYRQVMEMAKANVSRRKEQNNKKSKNQRRYRRMAENKHRRNNTLVEPQRRYVNEVNYIN